MNTILDQNHSWMTTFIWIFWNNTAGPWLSVCTEYITIINYLDSKMEISLIKEWKEKGIPLLCITCLYLDLLFICSYTGCPKKHSNSVTNLISSLLWISIVIPNFKSHNTIMSARVYFMKRVKYCRNCVYNVSARWTVKTHKFTLFVYCNFLVLLSTTLYAVKT